MKSLILSLILLTNLALQTFGLSLYQEGPPLIEVPQSDRYENIVTQASKAVVLVTGYQKIPIKFVDIRDGVPGEKEELTIPISYGSAFFVTQDGYLITNKHVVSKNDVSYTVDTGEAELEAKIVYLDPDYDLAILKVEGNNFPTLNFKENNKLSVGEGVIAIGNVYGRYIDSVSTGSVVSLKEDIVVTDRMRIPNGRVLTQSEDLKNLIEVSAKLYPGDSGGPLLNQDGEVVGVNVATAVNEPVGYAIPIDTARVVMQRAGIA